MTNCPDIEICSREGKQIHKDWYDTWCTGHAKIPCWMYTKRHDDQRVKTPLEWSQQTCPAP